MPTVAIPRPARVEPVSLSRLTVDHDGDRHGELLGADRRVTGITSGTAFVRPGDLFAGLPGTHAHGAAYAAQAIAAGAVAVLTDEVGRTMVPGEVPLVLVPDVRDWLGYTASVVYGEPSSVVNVLGVTGTSGKTTTTFLVEAGLRAGGRVPGLIGTVATHVGDVEIKTGFTTPEAPELQALLAVMREDAVSDVAMEVSSHALALGRADGIGFAVGAFTNLSQDHLDFHADMDDYFAAKARLFDGRARTSIVMTDDEWGRRIAEIAGTGTVTVNTTGDPGAAWQARDVHTADGGGTAFRVVSPGGEFDAACAIPGGYNVANALLALAILDAVGVPPALAAPVISTASVPGRMERIDAGQSFLAVVDYSHKPAAVDGALQALRPLTRGRLIVVLGSGGDRDTGKRPHMGEIAARGADLLVLTDDNPRSEDPAVIRRAMLDGALALPPGERGEVVEIGDRAVAIAHAVAAARPGDTVLVAGKGHESGQEIVGVVHPFDDRDVLRLALENR
ncbi:MAG: UDP-N-acetylmuramoyl-L-alanyl-D-glutamate--2,6-diaminopimelate ligase [Jatrophihabitantaceae bacterium]